MTNQNDTQDEAKPTLMEKLEELESRDPGCRPYAGQCSWDAVYQKGYRAGVASRDEEYKRSPLSLALCKSAGINVELMEDMEKLKRENEQLKTALETQTRNMDWLNNENTLVETKLAAEKQKALKLVEAVKNIANKIDLSEWQDKFVSPSIAFYQAHNELHKALADYSTDSGDGSGNG